MAPVVQERVAVLGEVPAMVDFLFLDTPVFDPDSWAKAVAGDDGAPAILAAAIAAYEALRGDWTAAALHAATLGWPSRSAASSARPRPRSGSP